MKIQNFSEQYYFSQKLFIDAIRKGSNVVLFGSGANGKTHLIKGMETILKNRKYNTHELLAESFNNSRSFNGFVKKQNYKRWVVSINDVDTIHSTLKNSEFVLINMDQFVYPKYSTLRSGRCI